MQSHQFASKIQAEAMSRHIRARARAVETLENIRLFGRRDAPAGVCDPQLYLFVCFAGAGSG